ncbi:MAG: hypothetical protein CL607_09450 [Anaerolineaceae bacterium]|nr:hypothetical protein [Anaerolineaceae bacterium]
MNDTKLLKSKGLEQKLYLTYHQDGLLDLTIGIIIALFGLVILADQPAFVGLIAIPGVLYIPFKQSISRPRMGLIRFESEQKQALKLTLSMLLGVAVLIALIVLFTLTGGMPENIQALIRDNMRLIFSGFLGVSLLAVATLLNNRRFYLYAVVGVLLVWASMLVPFHLGIAVMALAAILILTGIALLVQFIRDYPLEDE